MGDNRGIILWTLGGAGVFLLYAAYKNQNPQTLLLNHLNGSTDSKPISTSTAKAAVPTATDNNGKTWNIAPGDGGYATTEPPTPRYPSGTNVQGGGTVLGGYRNVVPDLNGVYNVIDQNGLIIATVPNGYQNNPASYIPTVNA